MPPACKAGGIRLLVRHALGVPLALSIVVVAAALIVVGAAGNYLLVRRLDRKTGELLDVFIGPEPPSPRLRKKPYFRWAVTSLLGVVLAAVLALELINDPIYGFWVRHPIIASLGSGLLLGSLTAVTIERWRDHRRLRARRKPALLAFKAYIQVADDVNFSLTGAIEERVASLPGSALCGASDRETQLAAISSADPQWFPSFARLIEDQVRKTEEVLMRATDLLSQYPPLANVIDELEEMENELRFMAVFVGGFRPNLGQSPSPPKAQDLRAFSELLSRRHDRYRSVYRDVMAFSRLDQKKSFPKPRFYWREKQHLLSFLRIVLEVLEAEDPGSGVPPEA